jgi:hypothetical protein
MYVYYRYGEKMNKKLNKKYLNNGYFYLTCNECETLIKTEELTEEQYNLNGGYCLACKKKQQEV